MFANRVGYLKRKEHAERVVRDRAARQDVVYGMSQHGGYVTITFKRPEQPVVHAEEEASGLDLSHRSENDAMVDYL